MPSSWSKSANNLVLTDLGGNTPLRILAWVGGWCGVMRAKLEKLSSIKWRKRRLFFLLVLALLSSLFAQACTELITPGPPQTTGSDADVDATVRAAVAATLSAVSVTPFPTPQPDSSPQNPGVTESAQVQATITALLATPAVPGLSGNSATPDAPLPTPWPTLVPLATAASAPPPTPEATQLAPLPPPVTPLATVPTLRPTLQPTPTIALERNCQVAPDGTPVTAWIDGNSVASDLVANGNYQLFLAQPDGAAFSGKTVGFKIGELDADETAIWVQGGGDELHLSATTGPGSATSTPPASPDPLAHNGSLLAQLLPPHVFIGTATTCVLS